MVPLLALLAACSTVTTPPPAAAPSASVAADAGSRPLPHPISPPAYFEAAVAAGTRTHAGVPGPRYWTNWSEYRIDTRLLTDEKRLEGSGEIVYHNRSPDTLQILVLDLAQNIHAPGAVRLEPAEVTGGVELGRVSVAGQDLTPDGSGARYIVDGTKLILVPPDGVLPGESVEIAVEWAFDVPQAGASGRMGWEDDNLFFIAYWYPQMAVYDDLAGWNPDQFLGISEFYAGFGSYDVTVEAPAGWLLVGTGELVNEQEVLAEPVLARLREAEQRDEVSQVVGPADFGRVTRAGTGAVRWHFQADSVRDFAFSATRESVWDVTRTRVGDRDGDGDADHARIGAIYREPAFRWAEVARYSQHSIEFLSDYTGLPYPWPHMTAVEGSGIIGGGMEFPMMTLIGDYTAAGDEALYNVTAHELAHMWIPMIASTDERRYSWIDEGTTSFNENQARKDFFPGSSPEQAEAQPYLQVARAGLEGEIVRRSSFHDPGPAYSIASYSKPATVLAALRAVLGEEVFLEGLRGFIDAWAYRHPHPWDFWNAFEGAAGRDLDWFWSAWYFETWVMDQAVASVQATPGGTVVTVEDHGLAPMPVILRVTRADGSVEEREIPVERWLSGATAATVTLPAGAAVTRVEIDPDHRFPDLNRADNVWTP